MNENLKTLAQRAGFVLWGDEEWNPGDIIDWASRYDNALVEYTRLLVNEVLELQAAGTDVPAYFGITANDGKESIDVEFSDEEILQYMKLAHERDITFNKFIELALRKAIEEHDLKDKENEGSEAS
jgi:hypothetical protein